jgi:hypothetical protein
MSANRQTDVTGARARSGVLRRRESAAGAAPMAATLLSPALRLTAPVPRPDPGRRPASEGLAAARRGTLPVAKLRVAGQFASAIVTRVRRHCPPVRALSGNAARCPTLFFLSQGETRKTSHGTKYRNGDEYLGHAPPPLLDILPRGAPQPDEFAAFRPSHNTPDYRDGTWWQTRHTSNIENVRG